MRRPHRHKPVRLVGIVAGLVARRPPERGRRLALASLILLTSVAVGAAVSWWLVPGYLGLMAWLLAGPRAESPEPSSTRFRLAEVPAALPEPAEPREVAEAALPIAPAEMPEPAKKPKRRKRAAKSALPADETATWVRVGPGKFVRVDGSMNADESGSLGSAEVPEGAADEVSSASPGGPGPGDLETKSTDLTGSPEHGHIEATVDHEPVEPRTCAQAELEEAVLPRGKFKWLAARRTRGPIRSNRGSTKRNAPGGRVETRLRRVRIRTRPVALGRCSRRPTGRSPSPRPRR